MYQWNRFYGCFPAVACSGYANTMSFWSLPCSAVGLPGLQSHYLLLDIAGLKITVGTFSVLTSVLIICIFSVCMEIYIAFSQARSLRRAWLWLLYAAVWSCLWYNCLSWNESCIFSPCYLMYVRAGSSAEALCAGRNQSWFCWVFGSSWEHLNVARRKRQLC